MLSSEFYHLVLLWRFSLLMWGSMKSLRVLPRGLAIYCNRTANIQYSPYSFLLLLSVFKDGHIQTKDRQNTVYESTWIHWKFSSRDQKLISRSPIHTLLQWHFQEKKTANTKICARYFTYCSKKGTRISVDKLILLLKTVFTSSSIGFPS